MMNFNRKGAIFDLDGTLLESMGVWRKIDEEFLGKRGILVPQDYLEAITSKNFDQAAVYTIERFGLSETVEAVIAEWFAMALDAYSNQVELKKGVAAYLEALAAEGIQITAATSSDPSLFQPCLKHLGIYHYFSFFALTSQVERPKGFPDVYHLAAQHMGLQPEECVVYEDILKGIEGAKAGGYYTVGVEDVHSAYEWEEICSLADVSIHSFDELLLRP